MAIHTTYISIGSNLGDKIDNCLNGIKILTESNDSHLQNQSRFYKTTPVDYTRQDWFVNGVIKIETSLDPFKLLTEIKKIEFDAGRVDKSLRFGPRVLDMDIIFFDNIKISTPKLEIPHPRMHKRCFVLKPICDINPDIIHPILEKDMSYLLNNLDDPDQKVVLYQ